MSTELISPPVENRASFLARLNHFSPEDIDFVMYAYDVAKISHKGTFRQGGQRYFEHPREVSLILLDECGIDDPSLIAASLLHDVAEDTPAFGSYMGKTYSEWIERVEDRVSRMFNESVADVVVHVTKPPVNLLDIQTSEMSHEVYELVLDDASADSMLVKMADRLHNLRTLSDTPTSKQIRKVEETRNVYFKLFKRVEEKYPNEYRYLKEQMEKAILDLNFLVS